MNQNGLMVYLEKLTEWSTLSYNLVKLFDFTDDKLHRRKKYTGPQGKKTRLFIKSKKSKPTSYFSTTRYKARYQERKLTALNFTFSQAPFKNKGYRKIWNVLRTQGIWLILSSFWEMHQWLNLISSLTIKLQ